ncbi:MAG: alpha/beta hydrolase [Gammaproteobacteria bacterium]|nr:alpha/beta hydrolase [Gammaproteobacteria bacterium]MDH3749900.1 alpha/beta hydrolase [Gammaproteobacteria bacterium]MDH3805842.1 alpha/beta hydrolase [Gammaproteobacteria bacterium]
MAMADTVEIETGANPGGSVIWLHGLGADGHDFEPIVPELCLPDRPALRFVFPHAPLRPVTINGGMTMRAWYDILSLDGDGPVDEAGIRSSAEILETLIAREKERGIDARNIVVAGFSQGGAIAMHVALRHPERLAGLMALSTYLPLSSYFQTEVVANPGAGNQELPIFMAHGSFDPMLPMTLGRSSADSLLESGFDVEWHDYPMAHAVCAEEIQDIRAWLIRVCAGFE